MAQLPSNATLKGSYFFRYLDVDAGGASDLAVSASGTIVFDGNGNYTVTGTQIDSNGPGAGSQTVNVTTPSGAAYSVFSSGMFSMVNPMDPQNATLFGGVGAGGIIVASSTESADVDLFIAIPISTASSNAALLGNYFVASLDFLNGDLTALNRNTFFSMTANGTGSLGTVTVKGTATNLGDAPTTQTSLGASYTVSANGSGTMTFPAPAGVAANSQLLSGAKTLYVSSDGNFFIAGGPGFDLIVGVKALPSNNASTVINGFYFTGALENDTDPTFGGVFATEGVANEFPNPGVEFSYQRANADFFNNANDLTQALAYFAFNADGTDTSYTNIQYAAGALGNIVIASGLGSNYELNLYVKIPPVTGTGVFLDPTRVQNAGSNAPFEASVSPGEALTLYGSGMVTQTQSAPGGTQFPTTLGGAQVTFSWPVNGNPVTVNVPIFFAGKQTSGGSDQISVLAPYALPTDGTVVTIQVTTGSVKSNAVTLYTGPASPGVLTQAQNGLGLSDILHANFTVATTANPVAVGETVSLFMVGLGPVSPAVTDGAPSPGNPLAKVTSQVLVFVDGFQATVSVQPVLAPGFAGLYQVNFTVPAGVGTGQSVTLEILTADANNNITADAFLDVIAGIGVVPIK